MNLEERWQRKHLTEKLSSTIMHVVKREKLSSTIMKNLNTLKVNEIAHGGQTRARVLTIIDCHQLLKTESLYNAIRAI